MVEVTFVDGVIVEVTFDKSFMGGGGATFVDSVMEILDLEVFELGAFLNLFLLSINCFMCLTRFYIHV